MDDRASELRTALESAPLASSEVARVGGLVRAAREQGVSLLAQAEWRGLCADVASWAERAQRSADTAFVLAELADLAAARLDEGERAALWYVRALELAPLDLGISERATLHLSRLGALPQLAHVLKEHARILDTMPWVDEAVRAGAWTRLQQLEAGPALVRPVKTRPFARREDTPTTPHVRRREQDDPEHDEASPLAASAVHSVAPGPRGRVTAALLGWAACVVAMLTLQGEDVSLAVREPVLVSAAAPPVPAPLPPRPASEAPEPQREVRPLRVSLPRRAIRVHAGLLGRRDVEGVVEPALEGLRRCPGGPGQGASLELDVTWLVRASGRVERVLLRDGGTLDGALRTCLEPRLRALRFPRGEREVMRIRARLVFAR